ncbi:MAG: TonB-linked SusC/RagA family outer membrane protein [Saprospiraceae bacterium]|jgi:TonB-linked SusC/RagA family outer membrane protein
MHNLFINIYYLIKSFSMKKLSLIMVTLLMTCAFAMAQRTVTGTITDSDGEPLISASLLVKGTTTGTVSDLSGNFSLEVPNDATTLVASYTGYGTQEININGLSTVAVVLEEGSVLNEVLVTALGIKREKKSLGYAAQEVDGEELTRVKDVNFINSLSGKVAGVDIRRSSTLGGSSSVIVRGFSSLTGNNQALFVVDGTPINNDISNTLNQQSGRGGYDYGNAAMDINPEDVESVTVLRGAAATALYGSRAANGVILVTTKKGAKNKNLGVSFSTGLTVGSIDKTTMPTYQKEFGHGYSNWRGWYGDPDGKALDTYDFGLGDGPQEVAVVYEDASFGAAFDGRQVYDWRSFFPQLDSYGKTFPWQAAKDGPETFYETALTYNNSVSIDGGSDNGSYRLSYTNFNQTGVVPNSEIKKNTVAFAATYDISPKLSASSSVNVINTNGKGRYGTGYNSRNVNQSFRQWYSTSVDLKQQEEAYDQTGANITWNPFATLDPSRATQPHYFDNYYWTVFENYSTDERNRLFGNMSLNYEFNSWLNLTGRVALDRFDEIQEERIAVGSVDVPMYMRYNKSYSEVNYDLLLNFNKYFGAADIFNLNGNLGTNIRRTNFSDIRAQTNGGLVVPGVYSLSNSVSGIAAPTENVQERGVNGYFAQASIGYNNMLYVDVSGRYDVSSTLPADNNAYFYPSAAMSFIFSELIDSDVLSFGKFRINYAEVGNDAPFASLATYYNLNTPFGGVPLASATSTQNNAGLVPERTKSWEVGVEMNFIQNRVGLDVSVYQSNSFDQILPVTVTAATGATRKFVNAGDIENRGVELALKVNPIKTADFSWDIGINWSKNENEVKELFGDQTNLQISTAQGGVSFNATVGQPYGTIRGTNYEYAKDANGNSVGEPLVFIPGGSFGEGARHLRTGSPEVIGDINPDWKMGVINGFSYKSIRLSALIDIQKGGDFFSLDNYYGFATGIYDISAGNNGKGNPVRDAVADGGGYEIGGDLANVDGDGNFILDADGNYTSGGANSTYGYARDFYTSNGYWASPNAKFIYDASYVKLREISITYSLPKRVFANSILAGMDVSLVGRNLWIIHSNSPYSDPEAGLSAGTYQLGNQSGAYPAVKEYGINLNVKF